MKDDTICWSVEFWWTHEKSTYSSSVGTMFPASMSIVDVIMECARWRNIDLLICTSINARREEP